jgi:hypothetical protein
MRTLPALMSVFGSLILQVCELGIWVAVMGAFVVNVGWLVWMLVRGKRGSSVAQAPLSGDTVLVWVLGSMELITGALVGIFAGIVYQYDRTLLPIQVPMYAFLALMAVVMIVSLIVYASEIIHVRAHPRL